MSAGNCTRMPGRKVVVIGIDGGTFEVFQPWVQEGTLPNFGKIMDRGVWGILKSCQPPVTSPAWKCFSTGKNPGKLGVFWWRQVDREAKRMVGSTAGVFQSPELWDYLGDGGYRVGILGMPLTYPPKPVNGFMISGGPYAKTQGYTHPPQLQQEIERSFHYQLHPKVILTRATIGSRRLAEDLLRMIDKKFELAEMLWERGDLDFLNVTLFYINNVQHYCWREAPVFEAWKCIDRHLERWLGRDVNLVIMSDHGICQVRRNFYIKNWLRREGYLQVHDHAPSSWHERLLNREKISSFANTLRLDYLLRWVPRRMLDFIPLPRQQVCDPSVYERLIDWERSKVTATPQGPIYLINCQDEVERTALCVELTEKLMALTDPESGKKVMRHVHRREDIYCGPFLEKAPDLVAESFPEVCIREGNPRMGNIFGYERAWRASNAPNGILMAYGPDIRSGYHISGAQIVDLAPTILHMFGVPIPREMDGKVLQELLAPGGALESSAVRYREEPELRVAQPSAYEDEEQLREQLRTLGYLD